MANLRDQHMFTSYVGHTLHVFETDTDLGISFSGLQWFLRLFNFVILLMIQFNCGFSEALQSQLD